MNGLDNDIHSQRKRVRSAMKLTDVQIGTKVKITSMFAMNPFIRRRLSDLCISEGSLITLDHLLPFSGPCMIEANGQAVAIRLKEAECIRVVAV